MASFSQNGLGFRLTPPNHQTAGKNSVKITAENGGYKVVTPFNKKFVETLKAYVPAIGRKWDSGQKAWFVSKQCGNDLKEVVERVFGFTPVLPTIAADGLSERFETVIEAEYVGGCNSHNGAASVYASGGWTAKIPESVLREFFKQTATNAGTLYALLGCDEHAAVEDIKRAYKRAARQWHPDICREENAREMFEQVKKAFDVLSNPESRNKYNAGLFFEKLSAQNRKTAYATFTPMLRCGRITAVGRRELGTFIVEKILAWDDITNEQGQTMVSFWSGTSHQIMWV